MHGEIGTWHSAATTGGLKPVMRSIEPAQDAS
jgi:hypothetical protein